MKLSDRIKAAEEELTALKDGLVDVTKKLEESPDDDTLVTAIEEQSEAIEKKTAALASLKRAEQALASTSQQVGTTGGSSTGSTSGSVSTKKHDPFGLMVKSAVIAFESGVRHIPAEQVIKERYSGDEKVKAVSDMMVKAAQDPAMTNVPGWAQELVQESVGAFMDLLKPEAIIPKLSLREFSFDKYGKITLPMRNSGKNLAGGFRAEGAPIRVGAATLGSIDLTPKSLGVIGTYSAEILKRSTPSIEALIRDFMITDTAEVLDKAFVDNVAASATRPAGIRNTIGASNTAASAGTTAANIQTDIKGRLGQMANLNMGKRLVWLMHPLRAIGVTMSLTATGTPAFPSMANNILMGIPVVTSTNMPSDIVLLIDQAELAWAGGVPVFDYSMEATIHEEDTTPLPIVDDGGTPVTANPVRSLWQTNSHGIRVVWELDWARMRSGAVQELTACAW